MLFSPFHLTLCHAVPVPHTVICSFNSYCLCQYFTTTTLPFFSCFVCYVTLFKRKPLPSPVFFPAPPCNPSLRVYVTWALWTWSVCLRPQRKCLWWWRSYMVTCWRWSSPVRKADCLRGSLSSSSHRCVCAPAKRVNVLCIDLHYAMTLKALLFLLLCLYKMCYCQWCLDAAPYWRSYPVCVVGVCACVCTHGCADSCSFETSAL